MGSTSTANCWNYDTSHTVDPPREALQSTAMHFSDLDEGLLLLARETAEPVEALALAVAVVEAAVGALGELRHASGGLAELDHGVTVRVASKGASAQLHVAGGDTGRDREGASAARLDVDLEEVLDTSLARFVREGDGEVHERGGGGLEGCRRAVVGNLLGVGVPANVLSAVGRDGLDAILADAASSGTRGGLDRDAVEDLVRKVAEGSLHVGRRSGVSGTGIDAVGAPDAAVRVVVDHDELLLRGAVQEAGAGVITADLDELGHHLRLYGGERVIALRRDAVSAVQAVVAEVALAALDLLGVPEVVEQAVILLDVVGAGSGGRDGLGDDGFGMGVGGGSTDLGASAGGVDVARAGAAVVEIASELVNELAGTVTGALLRAGGAAAALTLVAVEALALSGLAVADALVGALGVVVSLVGAVGGVGPRERVGARAERAVGALPVLVARALVIGAADAVARAAVRARGHGGADEGEESEVSHHL